MKIPRFELKIVVLLAGFVSNAYAPPAPTQKIPSPPTDQDEAPPSDVNHNEQVADTGLYYDQYLQKVIKLLESDENFRRKMESASFEEIRDGKFGDEVYQIPDAIRRQLDEAKKEEMSRLRKISHAKMQVDKGQRIRNSNALKDIASHLDVENVKSFEAKDLTSLIKAATKDLENFDEKRHQEFKRYQMTKDMRRQEKLRQMTEVDRKKAEREYEEMRKKHEDHPAMNHPGSKAQLNEVWEEEDGLKGQEFNPKTFFRLHDLNGDNSLDPMELEALFEKELEKVYNSSNEEDDMMEMEEERRRMRQHVMKEIDYNGDGLVGYDEFMKYTDTDKFGNPDQDSYKTVDQMIDDSEVYSSEELEEFRLMIKDQENDLKEKLAGLRKQAQNVVNLKSDVYSQEQKLGASPLEHEVAELEEKKEQMQHEEKVLKEMHEEIREQGKEIRQMREELRKQEEVTHRPVEEDQPSSDDEHHQQLRQENQQFQGDYQYQQPSEGGQQYQQPAQGDQQYQQPAHGDQQYQQPPRSDQQYRQPPRDDQQFQQPSHGDQQYRQPSRDDQQYRQPPRDDQQFQQPSRDDQQFQQPSRDDQQFQQPPDDDQQNRQPSRDDQQHRQPTSDDQQYRQPPRDDQQNQEPPRADQQYQQPPSDDQQYRQPPSDDQQYRQPPSADQQYRQPPSDDQQYRQPPSDGQQYRQPPRDDQQYQEPPRADQQYRQPPRDDQQYQQPPHGDQQSLDDQQYQQPPRDDQQYRQASQDFVDTQGSNDGQPQQMQHH